MTFLSTSRVSTRMLSCAAATIALWAAALLPEYLTALLFFAAAMVRFTFIALAGSKFRLQRAEFLFQRLHVILNLHDALRELRRLRLQHGRRRVDPRIEFLHEAHGVVASDCFHTANACRDAGSATSSTA